MARDSTKKGPTDDLNDGFTIGDVRVDPRTLDMSSESGRSVSVSRAAMGVLLLLAGKQPEAVPISEIHPGQTAEGSADNVAATIQELSAAFSKDLDRPGYLEVSGDYLRLLPAIDLPGRGRFSGLVALWQEIRKRRVFRVATTYALLTFIILQVADAMLDTLPVTPEFFPIMLAVLAIGFPVVVLLGWFFEITPQGIFLDRRRTSAVVNRTVATTGMIFLFGIAIGFAFAVFSVSDIERPRDDIAIAVLPFDNMSGRLEDQNISDGLVEELLNELTRIKELRVVGRKASFYYRDRNEEWDTIAEKLGANMIIEGSIRRNESTLRIAAQLIDKAGYHVWSNTFDAPADSSLDVLAVQRSIARQVANELPIELSPESRLALEAVPTTDEQAYQLYLQGRNYLRNADQMERFVSAEKLFRNALEVDPEFVNAMSGLCESQSLIYQRTQRPQDYAKAAASCARLIAEDELNAEGYVALGTLNRLSGNYVEAEEMFTSAVDLSPAHEPALYGLARAVEGQGRYEEAERYYLRSALLDPGYWQVYNGYGRYLERGGRFDEAIEQYYIVISLAPDNLDGHTNLGAAYFASDQWGEALQAWQRALEIQADPIGYLNVGTAEYYLGNFVAAEANFRAGIGMWGEFYPLWGKLGAALERQGKGEDSERAFENAVEYSRAAIEINNEDSRAMYYLASYLAHLGQSEEARSWAARAREISPRNPAVHYFSAIVESYAGNDEATVDALVEALRLGYSTRVIQADPYFQPHLNSAKLAEWMQEDT